MPWAIDRSPSKRWNSRERVGETHVVELADGPRREPVAAGLLPGTLLLDDEHVVAGAASQYAAAAPAGPPPTTSTSWRSVVGDISARRWPRRWAPSVVQFAGTGSWPDSTTRS